MLNFYSLYKQAVCGPCTVTRPGFWDPVGRYKWDAWSRLGGMSCEGAMEAYVDEMKKVAKEVLDTMPVDEKTASLIHHFEPLYLVVEDMPTPSQALLDLCQDSGLSQGLAPTSDSESEIFCDSLDSEEQLLCIKIKANAGLNGHAHSDSSSFRPRGHRTAAGATQVGSGQGGEGAEGDKGPPSMRRSGRDGPDQSWRERGAPPGGPRPPGHGVPNMGGGGGGAAGRSRGRGRAAARRPAAAADHRGPAAAAGGHAQRDGASGGGGASGCDTPSQEEDKWWPFEVSGHTLLLLLLWPLVAQGLQVLLLRRSQKRGSVSS
ncbi:hypothetical protein NHX12_024559 [Muraenolepis orangiensis]|uniref:ACB domain-containing protein n=1 Tax=Muraenolepis orangiensis TaxID=630683 RepID=A0A9Q0EJL1_9TELE|nr:hypothetical protein NHX12_024559 [Muraenolepis orangiensis]